ncbi:MAG: hypothetical protein ACKPKO_02485, partial [Candidatus Fonsibacter sp.]
TTGFTDPRIQADQVYFGNTIWLTATSIAIKFFVPACAVEGLFIGDAATPTTTTSKNENITTQGTITSGNLTTPNIYTKTEVATALNLKANQSTTYTKTEVDSLVSPKSDKTYVDSQLALKQPTITSSTDLTINKLITRT